jgi:hypothetical protein
MVFCAPFSVIPSLCLGFSSFFFLEIYMAVKPVYRVIFLNQSQVYELFASAIYQSEMYGFIEVEEFVFGERSQVLIDPAEEKLKQEFAGVKRSYIPMHAIVRIDEVEKEGPAKISEVKGGDGKGSGSDKIAHFPFGGFVPNPNLGE